MPFLSSNNFTIELMYIQSRDSIYSAGIYVHIYTILSAEEREPYVTLHDVTCEIDETGQNLNNS